MQARSLAARVAERHAARSAGPAARPHADFSAHMRRCDEGALRALRGVLHDNHARVSNDALALVAGIIRSGGVPAAAAEARRERAAASDETSSDSDSDSSSSSSSEGAGAGGGGGGGGARRTGTPPLGAAYRRAKRTTSSRCFALSAGHAAFVEKCAAVIDRTPYALYEAVGMLEMRCEKAARAARLEEKARGG